MLIGGQLPAFSQVDPVEQNRQAMVFLSKRCINFNRGQVPKRVDNLRGLTDSLDRAGVNYCHTVYVFYGEQLNLETCGGGSSRAVTGGTAVPFIKYRIYRHSGLTYIEVVDGNGYI